MDYILGQKTYLNKFKRTENIQGQFSEQSELHRQPVTKG